MQPLERLAEVPPAKQAFSFIQEFKSFAFKGNVIDLAVGVIIGAAVGKVIESLVKNVLMPLINLLLPGDKPWEHWSFAVGGKVVPYGLFLGEVLNFLIVALALFLFVVKLVSWLQRFHKEEAAAVPPMTKDQELLSEIRDLLKKMQPQPQG